MSSILYISYTGILDPLGQSQVLQYIIGLAADHRITILTFEKPANLSQQTRVAELQHRCRLAGVNWYFRTWHNRPSILASAYDIVTGMCTAIRLARHAEVKVVHCRSYIGGLIGLAVSRCTGARLIFDMRGFWADERVDGGIWSDRGLPYRLFKRVERSLFLNADYIVSLTRTAVREFTGFSYLKGRLPPVSVIPTCTNLALFRPIVTVKHGFTLGYVGSVGSWYMFDDVARAVKRLFDLRADARFLVLNKGGHTLIRQELEAAGVDMARVELRDVPFDEVAQHIARMDAGVFFIKPTWSKRASCPTRMGEFLACGKPCLANDGVGDVKEDLLETCTGVTLPATAAGAIDLSGLDSALSALLDLAYSPDISTRCRAAAEERFSLDSGIAKYSRIYSELSEIRKWA